MSDQDERIRIKAAKAMEILRKKQEISKSNVPSSGPIKVYSPTEESVLRFISARAVQVTAEEAQYDADTTTAADYDKWFSKALRERQDRVIRSGYGGIQHPTSRLFEIGIDSIRAGKPSELFLNLLEQIGKIAEERDVMAALFPDTFEGRIKTSTVRTAKREAQTVENFKEHLRKYLADPKTAKVTGNEDQGGKLSWIEKGYAEAIADLKRGRNLDERKAIDRALNNHGADIIAWRDQLIRSRKPE